MSFLREELTIDKLKLLKPNQKIEIIISQKGFVEIYKSRIEEITTNSLVLAMPMAKGHPIILLSGEKFCVKLIADGNVYQFESRFLDKRHTPLPVWLVSHPINMCKIQQRNFVRVDAALNVTIDIKENQELKDSTVQIKTITKDISGGGVLLISKIPLPLGKPLTLTLDLPDFGIVSTSGEVTRVDQPKLDQPIYWIGVKFTGLTEQQRSMIIKYVFKVQLERRKKGL